MNTLIERMMKLAPSRPMVERTENSIIVLRGILAEALLNTESLSESIDDNEYQLRASQARRSITPLDAAKHHQAAGLRASELGHYDQAERHMAAADGFRKLHNKAQASGASKPKLPVAKKGQTTNVTPNRRWGAPAV